jgi:ATP-dependent Lon protease
MSKIEMSKNVASAGTGAGQAQHTYNTRSKTSPCKTYKRDESSDDDDDDDVDEEYEPEMISMDEDEDEEDPSQSFQQLLSNLFPSNYMNTKLANQKIEKERKKQGAKAKPDTKSKAKPKADTKGKSFTKSELFPRNAPSPSPRSYCPSPNKFDKYLVEESPSSPSKMSNFNIVFTINPDLNKKPKSMDEYEEYHTTDEEGEPEDIEDIEDTEDEDIEDISEDDYEDEDIEDEDEEEDADDAMDGLTAVSEARKYIDALPDIQRANPIIKGMIKKIHKREQKNLQKKDRLCKKRKYKNTLKFRDLLQQKNVMNDVNYFQEKMSLQQQEDVLTQIAEIKSIIDIEKPYRLALLEAAIPARYKACAYNKLSALKNMEPGCSEYNKVKHWVDDFMRIPFNKINHLPVRIEDGVEKCHAFMENAKNTLDKAVYGLNDVKLQVMQMVGQWITNPDAIGNSVAIEGPPGTGKTTLVKEGISKIMNREFVFIPLGGATDSSCLEGHSYTYEGSNCGLIVKQLIQCQSMNPIIYFDELDKISDTPKGEEIVGILTHLTDTSQNSSFHDKYFAEFSFDLSRCVFFFSYNDRSKVNRILLDRMHCIMTKGYELPQKTIISKDYLLPTIREQVRFKAEDILLPDETIEHIINTHTYKEDGVRNLKRCLEIIHTKLNLYRLMKPETNLFASDMALTVTFPITITPHIVDKLIKKHTESGSWQNMYM